MSFSPEESNSQVTVLLSESFTIQGIGTNNSLLVFAGISKAYIVTGYPEWVNNAFVCEWDNLKFLWTNCTNHVIGSISDIEDAIEDGREDSGGTGTIDASDVIITADQINQEFQTGDTYTLQDKANFDARQINNSFLNISVSDSVTDSGAALFTPTTSQPFACMPASINGNNIPIVAFPTFTSQTGTTFGSTLRFDNNTFQSSTLSALDINSTAYPGCNFTIAPAYSGGRTNNAGILKVELAYYMRVINNPTGQRDVAEVGIIAEQNESVPFRQLLSFGNVSDNAFNIPTRDDPSIGESDVVYWRLISGSIGGSQIVRFCPYVQLIDTTGDPSDLPSIAFSITKLSAEVCYQTSSEGATNPTIPQQGTITPFVGQIPGTTSETTDLTIALVGTNVLEVQSYPGGFSSLDTHQWYSNALLVSTNASYTIPPNAINASYSLRVGGVKYSNHITAGFRSKFFIKNSFDSVGTYNQATGTYSGVVIPANGLVIYDNTTAGDPDIPPGTNNTLYYNITVNTQGQGAISIELETSDDGGVSWVAIPNSGSIIDSGSIVTFGVYQDAADVSRTMIINPSLTNRRYRAILNRSSGTPPVVVLSDTNTRSGLIITENIP